MYEEKGADKENYVCGCVVVRHGARHDLYRNPKTGKKQTIPRHNEIDESLAKHILKELA